MKVAILAGGYGTRLSEETDLRPKPMVEIGGKPILWHIMRHYSHFGFKDFVILAGYKAYMIKEYFMNYSPHHSDFTIETRTGKVEYHDSFAEDWRVTILDTGLETMTGGRLRRAQKHLQDAPFLLTYGDGVSNIDLSRLVKQHRESKAIVTLTAVQPEARFGVLDFGADHLVRQFVEKPKGDGAWINAGFFACDPAIFNYLDAGDATVFERSPLETVANQGKLCAYKHDGFWRCMDTLRDKMQLQAMWDQGQVPWQL